MQTIYMDRAQTLPVNGFKWVEETSQFNDFKKIYNEDSDKG